MKSFFTQGWKFWEAEYGTDYKAAMEHLGDFTDVEIPHDYLIHDTANLYKDSTGWYIKDFELTEDDEDKKIFLIFDGIYMDSIVYVNGEAAGEWKYGYSQFVLDITEYVKIGTNSLAVAARCKFPNTRWYSGAGIYRNVWLCKYEKTYIPENGIYVHSEKADGGYNLFVSTEVCGEDVKLAEECAANESASADMMRNGESIHVFYELFDCEGNKVPLIEKECDVKASLPAINEKACASHRVLFAKDVKEWDVKNPVLYKLVVRLESDCGEASAESASESMNTEAGAVTSGNTKGCGLIQKEIVTIGFRDVRMDPDHGFFLNGRNMKLNGVCIHHDLGALGSAYNNTAMRRRLIQLKEMGVNAIRLTHNMYDPHVISLADEMGFLLVSEAFDMWEGPKTEFDYARFFPEWHAKDVASWVRRDRNHPSVIMWSIGNEIYDTHSSERGQEVTRDLKSLVELHDPMKNAVATIGSNYMPWEMAQKCADILKVAGYNYAENYYEQHHKEHPDWIIYGSETYSIVQSRGVYHFPLDVPILCDSDEQCSSLGNSTTSWGADSVQACICKDRDMEFSMGQFIWTGYDYIGEPTPYHTKNSYFGLIDTAGFYKDAFYAWKSAWVSAEDDPFVHVFPYWDFNEGQLIDVRVVSNAPEVELFVNGKSLGRQILTHEPHSGDKIFADYRVAYEKGELKAVAYDASGKEIATDVHRSFGDTDRFVVEIDNRVSEYLKTHNKGNACRIGVVDNKTEHGDSCRIDVVDNQENHGDACGIGVAENKIGKVTGFPEDADAQDMIFAEISAIDKAGNPVENASDYVNVTVSGDGVLVGLDNGDSTDYDSYQSSCRKLFNGKLLAIVKCTGDPDSIKIDVTRAEKVPVRKVELKVCGSDKADKECSNDFRVEDSLEKQKVLTKDNTKICVQAVIYPQDATDKEITFRALNPNGTDTNIAKITQKGDICEIEALGDGEFILRCEAKSGREVVSVMSCLEFKVEGVGTAYLDPYGFIPGSLYTSYVGQIGSGNDHGVASAKGEETVISFSGIDFGKDGSDEITVPIFTLNDDEYVIEVWKGICGEPDSKLLKKALYQKKSIWNVYQEDTWKLSERLTDIQSISFKVFNKMHIKGFSFAKQSRAFYDVRALDADSIYGDTFTKTDSCVEGIGNNVTLAFENIDFGDKGTKEVVIRGRASEGTNTIHLRFKNGSEEVKEILEFEQCDEYTERHFAIEERKGVWNLSFVFLPGSNFDFESFRFE